MRLVIADYDDVTNVITAEAERETVAEADALVSLQISEGFAKAFHVEKPVPYETTNYWKVDPVAETITLDVAGRDQEQVMGVWIEGMVLSDKDLMPRIAEDIIDTMTPTQFGKLPERVRDNHAAKKILRGQKP